MADRLDPARNWMDAVSPRSPTATSPSMTERRLRIVADGFRFTNEIRFDAREEWLYVVEPAGPASPG